LAFTKPEASLIPPPCRSGFNPTVNPLLSFSIAVIEDTTEIPENLRYYIDYDAIARDMKINGEIIEIDHDLIVTNAYDF